MEAAAQTKQIEPTQALKKLFLFAAFILTFFLSRNVHWLPESKDGLSHWFLMAWCFGVAPLIATCFEKKRFVQSYFPIAACLGMYALFCSPSGGSVGFLYMGLILFSYACGGTVMTRDKPVKSKWDRLLFLMSTRRALFWYMNVFALILSASSYEKVTTNERIYWAILAVFSTISIWVTPSEVAPTSIPVRNL